MSEKKEFKLTAAGYAEIEAELAKLREEDRPRIIQAIKEARAQGDLSENADYDAAREEQAKTESKIKELEYMLEHATIIKGAKKGTVGLGSKVTIKYVDDGEVDEYQIVGSQEADPFSSKISNESPIAQALLDKKVGDIVDVNSPNGVYQIEITAIA